MVNYVVGANGLFGMIKEVGKIFFLICFFLPSFLFSKVNPIVTEKIKSIPITDQKIIHDFFCNMISQGDFTDVLLGDKPSSNHCWVWWFAKAKERKVKDFLFLTYKGWMTWKKYCYLFPEAKYSFLEEGYNNGCFSVWFINKELIDEDSLKQFFKENTFSGFGISMHRKMGKFLGYPQKDVDGFCEKIQLELLVQYFPYEIEDIDSAQRHQEIEVDDLINSNKDPISRLDVLKKDLKLVPVFIRESNFFPTRSYGYCSFSEKIPDGVEWKQKVVDLYNSDDFLGEVLTFFVE